MKSNYFFELATAFWINLAAGYFLAIAISPSVIEKINSTIYCFLCFGIAYYSREQQK